MNPNPTQVAAIKAYVTGLAGGWSNTDAQIRASIAADLVANPVPRGTVAAPFTAAELVNACSAGNRAALGPYLIGAGPLIVAQDGVHLAAGIAALALVGTISAADATAMQAVATATEPDPSWAAQVTWDVAALGRPIDDHDLETARYA